MLLITGICSMGCKRSESHEPARQPGQGLDVHEPAFVAARKGEQPADPLPDWAQAHARLGPPSLMMWHEVGERSEWSVLRPPRLEARLFTHASLFGVDSATPSWSCRTRLA